MGAFRVRGGRSAWPLLTAGLLVAGLVTTGCESDGSATPTPTPTVTTTAADPIELTFGVWGNQAEVEAWQEVVDQYNVVTDESQVSLRDWPTHEAMRADLAGGAALPDVLLSAREDLAWLREDDRTIPVDNLLDERGVEFGDGYSRDALEAFSADSRLQCMPYGISPMVVYYNTDLVDFERMRNRDLPAPDVEGNDNPRWSFEQFAAAADFATRPRRGTRGVHVEATLQGLAPFVHSGGGSLFADDATSLNLSGDDSRSALERTLEVLRNPQITLTEDQLERASALEWFERGRLGMVVGYRSLVPRLRQVVGLHFDVMPMPVLDSSATVGNLTGLCLARSTVNAAEAADFLVHATSTDAVIEVARAGYLTPANLEVAVSDHFLQPGRQPEHAMVFNNAVPSVQVMPLIEDWEALEDAVRPGLRELVTVPVLDDLDERTEAIDERSRAVLDPED